MSSRFSDIKFGYAEAEREGVYDPDLLVRGFYDLVHVEKKLTAGDAFLVLGRKGSGKSAVGQRLKLLADVSDATFVAKSPVSLDQFPFTNFKRIVLSEAEEEGRFPLAWELLLLVLLIGQLAEDRTSDYLSRPIVKDALKALDKLDLNPHANTLPKMVEKTAKRTFHVEAAKVFGFASEKTRETREASLERLFSYLMGVVSHFRGSKTHIITVDGLDGIIRADQSQLRVLRGLLDGVRQLNQDLHQRGVRAKVVVLCRTDLFERIPSANMNKIRQDYALELDWYDDTREPRLSHLNRLVNQRAQLADPNISDVLSHFLPARFEGVRPHAFLLGLTRHTPRDLVQLLRYIQLRAEGVEGSLDRKIVLAGTRDYSQKYLLPEMKDEIEGLVDAEQKDLLFAFLSVLRKPEYTLDELRSLKSAQSRFSQLDLEGALHLLFECSALGNKFVNERSSTPYFVYRFRNPRASISYEHSFIVHRGLYKELNIA